MAGFSERTRGGIKSRDGDACVLCGLPLYAGANIHHRAPRGMGGSSSDWVNQSANGLLVCGSGTSGCHGRIESNRARSLQLGFLIPRSSGVVASEVPIWLPVYGGWFFLDNSGGRRELLASEIEEFELENPVRVLFL